MSKLSVKRGLLAVLVGCSCLVAHGQSPTLTVFTPTGPSGDSQEFIIEISGAGLITPDIPRVIVYPATGTSDVTILGTATAALIRGEFTAPKGYELGEIILSHAAGPPLAISAGKTCSPESDIQSSYTMVPSDQAKNKYGNGIAKNFDVIQISIVNNCGVAVAVPLAGFRLTVVGQEAAQKAGNYIVPFSLDHVTSVYSTDRKLTGTRAIFFNILQALATLGSSVEPFFGRGFTQGVSIEGGGFTQAMQAVFKDMSAEQLQNLTSQSFGSTEQISPNGGALQKFLFVQRSPGTTSGGKKVKNLSLFEQVGKGQVGLTFLAAPVQAASPVKSAGP